MITDLEFVPDYAVASDLHRERADRAIDAAYERKSRPRLVDVAREVIRYRGGDRRADLSDAELCRMAFSMPEGVTALAAIVNSKILTAFRSAPDSTRGWTYRDALPNFLEAKAATVGEPIQLNAIGRGETAAAAHFEVAAQGYRLARYGIRFTLDDQDYSDQRPLDVQLVALSEAGRAAARIVPDLVFAVLLENQQMDGDGLTIFNATHANLGSDALGSTGLYAGLAAVGNQVLTARNGDAVHLGMSGRYLILPPDLYGAGKALANSLVTGHDDLIVRSDSRLGAAGVTNPASGVTITGSATNWLLSASADQRPGVVVSTWRGETEPRVRSFQPSGGQWGIGFDLNFTAAATVADWRPLYYSTGLGA